MFGFCSTTSGVIDGGRAMPDGRSVAGDRAAPRGRSAIAEVLEQVTRLGADELGADSWTASDRTGALRDLDRITAVVTTLRGRLLVAEKRAETSLRPGDRDFESARCRLTRAGLGEVRREVRQAETLEAMPTVADAVRTGRMPIGHLDALARVAADASTVASAVLEAPEVQRRLVTLAERQPLKEFAASAARLVAEVDPDGLERSAAAQHRARFLVLSHQPDGTLVRGRLDRMAGEVLRAALAATGQAPDEYRDKPQADADALMALAERALSGMAGLRARRTDARGRTAEDPDQDAADARVSGVAGRPNIALLVPAATFVELRDHERSRAATGQAAVTGQAAGAGSTWGPVAPATLEDGTPVAMSSLAAALCDCEISRMVMDADSLPLDVGRSQRLYTGAQRRAVIVRDRQCAWNGCEVPAAYCEVHHIRWWDRDRGPTSVENGLLVCSHHHTVVHRFDLAVERLRGDGQPPGARHPVTLPALVRYAFRRRDGATVNAPPVPTSVPLPSPATGRSQASHSTAAGLPNRAPAPAQAGAQAGAPARAPAGAPTRDQVLTTC